LLLLPSHIRVMLLGIFSAAQARKSSIPPLTGLPHFCSANKLDTLMQIIIYICNTTIYYI
jgi:hypothetical protein